MYIIAYIISHVNNHFGSGFRSFNIILFEYFCTFIHQINYWEMQAVIDQMLQTFFRTTHYNTCR